MVPPRCGRSRPTPWSTTGATPTRSSCRPLAVSRSTGSTPPPSTASTPSCASAAASASTATGACATASHQCVRARSSGCASAARSASTRLLRAGHPHDPKRHPRHPCGAVGRLQAGHGLGLDQPQPSPADHPASGRAQRELRILTRRLNMKDRSPHQHQRRARPTVIHLGQRGRQRSTCFSLWLGQGSPARLGE